MAFKAVGPDAIFYRETVGREDPGAFFGHVNMKRVIGGGKVIKGDQEGIAAKVVEGRGRDQSTTVSLTPRNKSIKKEGLVNCTPNY